jgi:hypothetical protein
MPAKFCSHSAQQHIIANVLVIESPSNPVTDASRTIGEVSNHHLNGFALANGLMDELVPDECTTSCATLRIKKICGDDTDANALDKCSEFHDSLNHSAT